VEASPFFAGWKQCPSCTGPLEIEGKGATCRSCGRKVYANPAPTASAIVVDDDGRVLLARRAGDVGEGMWDIPGGFVEEGEDGVEALRRELQEETGVEIEPTAFLGAFPDRYGEDGIHTLNLYWTARIVSGEPSPADDVADLAWFAPDALPAEGEFAFKNSVQALERWRGRVRSGTTSE
jgi:ADP-ribose pyrophosphatase YjhB (NUDIX family)